MGKKTITRHVKTLIDSASCNPKKSFKKFNEIGAGEYGKVYKACINDACLNTLAVKNSSDNMSAEYLITKRLDTLGVPHVYGYEKCANRDFLFSEFINGVTLKTFLARRKVDPDAVKAIIKQVVSILKTIHEKYPSFRHHDLHLDNIMVLRKRSEPKVEVKLMDFGLATMNGVINPIVTKSTTFKTAYGIFPRSDPAYDVHLFLSSMYTSKGAASARGLIESLFKPEYLVKESNAVKEFRLRHDVVHDLPTYDTVLRRPYFSAPRNTVKTFIAKIPLPPKKKNLVPVKKMTSPVNQAEAKKKAMNVLKKIANAKKAPIKKKPPGLMKPPSKPLTVRSTQK